MEDQETLTIGEKVKKLRTKEGLTLAELQELSGISKTYLSDLETGKAGNPTISIIRKIAKALDTSETELLSNQIPTQRSGLTYGAPRIFDELSKEHDINKSFYQGALSLVDEVLTDQSIPKKRREELAREIISFMKWIQKMARSLKEDS